MQVSAQHIKKYLASGHIDNTVITRNLVDSFLVFYSPEANKCLSNKCFLVKCLWPLTNDPNIVVSQMFVDKMWLDKIVLNQKIYFLYQGESVKY